MILCVSTIIGCSSPPNNTSPTWTSQKSPVSDQVPLACICGTSSTDVFAVGGQGTIIHYDGNMWSGMTSGTTYPLLGVWGSSSSNVYVVGSGGLILHYDGNTWSNMPNGTTSHLFGVWGSSSSDVFAVGDQGIILHYSKK